MNDLCNLSMHFGTGPKKFNLVHQIVSSWEGYVSREVYVGWA